MHKKVSILSVCLVALLVVSFAAAQVSYSDSPYTSYQVVNLSGTDNAQIVVTYYDASGVPSSYQPTYNNVPPGGSVTVQQALESSLTSGRYSAVISSNQPIAAIANQQLGTDGSGTSIAPFSSYSGADGGSTSVTLPVIMYNWYGYYTEVYIQNVGGSAATNVQITYNPTSLSGCTTGATGQTETVASAGNPLAQYATKEISQFANSSLGAPNVGGCSSFTGRFLGAATVTSDEPIVVIVNQIVQDKLFTYNGFTSSGTKLIAPAYMRDFYNYYASLTIANPGGTDAHVTLTYTSDSALSIPTSTVVTATHTVPAGESITLYDGPGSGSDVSDLTSFTQFFGSVVIDSDQPVVAMVNQESTSAGGNQAGSYNAFSATEGTTKISVPLIQSDFYGYYTSLTIMTVDGNEATVNITYTSDGTYSAVQNTSKTYTHTTVGGFLNRYEGPTAQTSQSDLLDDLTWQAGGTGRFLGSAVIEVTSGSNIVAFVNSESNTAPYATSRDSLYSYNAFNLP